MLHVKFNQSEEPEGHKGWHIRLISDGSNTNASKTTDELHFTGCEMFISHLQSEEWTSAGSAKFRLQHPKYTMTLHLQMLHLKDVPLLQGRKKWDFPFTQSDAHSLIRHDTIVTNAVGLKAANIG